MESLLTQAVRKFSSSEHIKRILEGEWMSLYDQEGKQLVGIRGRIGAAGVTLDGTEIGADLIEMQPGSAFPLHTHVGDHILYIIDGYASVHVDGVDHRVVAGDTIYIPAEYPHAVHAPEPGAVEPVRILAVGHPHKALTALDRMAVLHRH